MKQKIFIVQQGTQAFIYVFYEGSFESPKIYINKIFNKNIQMVILTILVVLELVLILELPK